MRNPIQVSAWGFRHELGPMTMPFRNAEGQLDRRVVRDLPMRVSLADIPAHVARTWAADGTEIPDWCLDGASPEQRAALGEELRRTGMTFGLLCLDTRAIGEGADQRAFELAEMRRLIALAAPLGARGARVNIYPPPIVAEGARAPFDTIVTDLHALAAWSAGEGVRLMIENHCELTNTSEAMNALLDAVGSDLGLVLDTGNLEPVQAAVVAGYTTGRPFADLADASAAYRVLTEMLPRAEVVQLKTYGFHFDGRSRVYDLARVIALIAESGFKGPITIECATQDEDDTDTTVARTIAMVRDA